MGAAESWAQRLAPEPFRDFLPYTSASALKVIHATQVLRKAIDVARHVSSHVDRESHVAALHVSLNAAGLGDQLSVSMEPARRFNPAELTELERRLVGERVLALYFHVLRWDGPWFLDLRPRHFGWDAEKRLLTFSPCGLWYQPEPDFVRRVRSLYAGFYCNDASELAAGIELYGWNCTPSPGFEQRIEVLLRDHFAPADASERRFSIAHFRATFDAIFKEVAQSRAKLHPDLTFLGVELVGLYLTLESLAVALSPRRAFDRGAQLQQTRLGFGEPAA
ncbi:MAG: hypothetical protein ABI488_01900 [Polyangiaceae bacterium]